MPKPLFQMADPERFERPTPRFVVWCSIQLSYGSVVGRVPRVPGGGMQAKNGALL